VGGGAPLYRGGGTPPTQGGIFLGVGWIARKCRPPPSILDNFSFL
jgi:hypothetical protein